MAIRLLPRRGLAGYAALMAVLAATHYAFPAAREALMAAIDIAGTAALLVGVARNCPARRAPWLLLAAGNLTGVLGLLAGRLQAPDGTAAAPAPVYVTVIYLAGYPLYIGALLL